MDPEEEEQEALSSLLMRTNPRGKIWYPRPSGLQASHAEGSAQNLGHEGVYSNPLDATNAWYTSTNPSPTTTMGDPGSMMAPPAQIADSSKHHFSATAYGSPTPLAKAPSGATSSTADAAYNEALEAWSILSNEGEWHLADWQATSQREMQYKLVGELRVFESEGQLFKIAMTTGTKTCIIYVRLEDNYTMLMPRSKEAYEIRAGLQREDSILVPQRPGELSRRVGVLLESANLRPILWIENLETGQAGNSLLDDVLARNHLMK